MGARAGENLVEVIQLLAQAALYRLALLYLGPQLSQLLRLIAVEAPACVACDMTQFRVNALLAKTGEDPRPGLASCHALAPNRPAISFKGCLHSTLHRKHPLHIEIWRGRYRETLSACHEQVRMLSQAQSLTVHSPARLLASQGLSWQQQAHAPRLSVARQLAESARETDSESDRQAMSV